MSQIALISNQHDNNVGIGVISQLFQPPRDIVICLVLADVVDQQGTNSASVVCGCDCPVSFLACRIPNLRFDCLGVHLDGTGCKLDADGGLRVKIEFIAGEPAEKVGLSDARVTDQND